MGCDIHVHGEVKVAGLWHHYSAPYVSRDYNLFAYMAGVRAGNSGITPIAEPRGIPADISLITWIDYMKMGTDGHTHSWLSGEEVVKLGEKLQECITQKESYYWIENIFGYVFGNG